MKPEDRIIVAIDGNDITEIRGVINELRSVAKWFKLRPSQLLSSRAGWDMFNDLRWSGALGRDPQLRIFYDRKLYDISSAMLEEIRAMAMFGIDMFTIHLHPEVNPESAEVLRRALEQRGKSLAIGVGELSSRRNRQGGLRSFFKTATSVIRNFAAEAMSLGLDGIVVSGEEIAAVRGDPIFRDLIIVAAGIRPWPVSADDQAHKLTPRQAILAGADYLVIGRPILNPPDGMLPKDAFLTIAKEIS